MLESRCNANWRDSGSCGDIYLRGRYVQRFLEDATLSKVANNEGPMPLDEEANMMGSSSLNTAALWSSCSGYK
jgi:hypothetical protein